MIGPKIKLIYQEKTNTSDGQGGFATTWNDISPFWGNLMEGISEAGKESFINDKKANVVEYFFIMDKPLRTPIKNNARFYKQDDGIYFQIIDVSNLAYINRSLEIRLKKIL